MEENGMQLAVKKTYRVLDTKSADRKNCEWCYWRHPGCSYCDITKEIIDLECGTCDVCKEEW